MTKLELLAPAGDFEKLKVAFHFGADACYVGLDDFSLRARTKNFNFKELKEAIDYTHKIQKKIYIALNIYFTPDQIDVLIYYLENIERLKPDGIILSDLGAIKLAGEYAKTIPIHISTQANTTNQYSAKLLKEIGAARIILARELTLSDIKVIRENVDITLEAFVHGAMCIAYSGRCLLSAYMTNSNLSKRDNFDSNEIRSANKGDCSHSCRWEYILKEKSRKNQEFYMEEDSDGTYVFSSKDICMIDYIKELAESGVDSFKIEGRMKSILYISGIVRAYRRAIDHFFDNTLLYDRDSIANELNIVSHREFSTGFFFDKPIDNANVTDTGIYKRNTRLASLIVKIKNTRIVLKNYNTFSNTDSLEYIGPNMKTIKIGRIVFYNKDNNLISKVNHTDYAEAEIFDENNNLILCEELDVIRFKSEF